MEQQFTWPGWEVVQLLGEGSFGKVYKIQRTEFGQTYEAALKVISVPANESEIKAAYEEGMDEESVTSYYASLVQDIVAEFALMSQLKGNSNIVSYEDHMVIERKDSIGWDILIRMELLTGLGDYCKEHPFTEMDVIKLGIHMAQALELCQKRNIIHRDIKPENIFVSKDGNFKLGDFGIARVAEKNISVMSKKGTYNYMAPEVYQGKEYGCAVDIYSVGIVMYRFLNDNRIPFLPPAPQPIKYVDREKALELRMAGTPVPTPKNGSTALHEIILKACAFRPEDRYDSPTELRIALGRLISEMIPGDSMALALGVFDNGASVSGIQSNPVKISDTYDDSQDDERTVRLPVGNMTSDKCATEVGNSQKDEPLLCAETEQISEPTERFDQGQKGLTDVQDEEEQQQISDVRMRDDSTGSAIKRERSTKKIMGVSAAILLIAVVVLGIFFFSNNSGKKLNDNYMKTLELAQGRRFSDAKQNIASVEYLNEQDSRLIAYIDAGMLYEAHDYMAASDKFESLMSYDYLESKQLYCECLDQYIDTHKAAAKSTAEIDILIGYMNSLMTVSYKDFTDDITELRLKGAELAIIEKKYSKALQFYTELKESGADITDAFNKYLIQVVSVVDADYSKYSSLVDELYDSRRAWAKEYPAYANIEKLYILHNSETMDELLAIIPFKNAADILLEKYAYDFLQGQWESYDGYYFYMSDDKDHTIQQNLYSEAKGCTGFLNNSFIVYDEGQTIDNGTVAGVFEYVSRDTVDVRLTTGKVVRLHKK